MPWDAQSFRKHNKKLTGAQAGKAARQANAILASGAPEGVAIATANKHIAKLRRSGRVNAKQSDKLQDRYGGKDQTSVDASSR